MAEEAKDVTNEMEPTVSFERISAEESESQKDLHMKNVLVRNYMYQLDNYQLYIMIN